MLESASFDTLKSNLFGECCEKAKRRYQMQKRKKIHTFGKEAPMPYK